MPTIQMCRNGVPEVDTLVERGCPFRPHLLVSLRVACVDHSQPHALPTR